MILLALAFLCFCIAFVCAYFAGVESAAELRTWDHDADLASRGRHPSGSDFDWRY